MGGDEVSEMSVYRTLVLDPKNRVIFEILVDSGLVRLNGKDDWERARFVLAEARMSFAEEKS